MVLKSQNLICQDYTLFRKSKIILTVNQLYFEADTNSCLNINNISSFGHYGISVQNSKSFQFNYFNAFLQQHKSQK